MSNIFALTGQEEIAPEKNPEFVPDDSDEFKVMVRFRNEEDYNKFADILGQPHLKRITKSSERVTVFPYVDTVVEFDEELFG